MSIEALPTVRQPTAASAIDRGGDLRDYFDKWGPARVPDTVEVSSIELAELRRKARAYDRHVLEVGTLQRAIAYGDDTSKDPVMRIGYLQSAIRCVSAVLSGLPV